MTTKTYEAPSQAQLEAKALNFVKTIQPEYYQELKRKGRLEKYCQQKALAAIRYAQNLIQSGEWDGNAWNRAIRLEILESESD